MNIEQLTEKVLKIKKLYSEYEIKKSYKPWTVEETIVGLASDVGDLGRLVLAKEGFREMPDLDKNIEHELAELLYTTLLLSSHYRIDLERAFLDETTRLEEKLS